MTTTALPALPIGRTDLVLVPPRESIQRQQRHVMIAAGVLVFGLGGAAALIPIDGAVIASGQIGVESRMKRVAHPIGGTIAEIYVRNGDRVAANAPLLRLDDKVSGSDAQLSALSVDQLLAQQARLEAEQTDAGQIAFPAELTSRQDPAAVRIMEDENRLFVSRRGEVDGMRAELAARISQYRGEIAGYSAQISSYQRQGSLVNTERDNLERLYQKGLVTLNRRNQAERQSIEFQGGAATARAQIAQAQARISEAREQMGNLGAKRRADAGTELVAVKSALNLQRQRQVSAGDVQSRAVIRAAHAGVVDKLAFASIGDVIKPAETIMEIVPDNDRRVVEVMINPADIDQTRVGDSARIRFTSLQAATTPELTGRVVQIAPAKTTDANTNQSFYQARIAIDAAELGRLGVRAIPGMPAEVFLKSGRRSMLSYMVKPISDQITRAFRDN